MNEFGVRATDEAIRYMGSIAAEMVRLFGVERAEAVGRIRSFWRHQTFLGKYELMALFHRDEEDWAKHIYYGAKPWWLPGPLPDPAPYPS